MILKCRFGNEDCDKSLYFCNDCKVIVDWLDKLDSLPDKNKPDLRDITWLGQAVSLLRQVANVDWPIQEP